MIFSAILVSSWSCNLLQESIRALFMRHHMMKILPRSPMASAAMADRTEIATFFPSSGSTHTWLRQDKARPCLCKLKACETKPRTKHLALSRENILLWIVAIFFVHWKCKLLNKQTIIARSNQPTGSTLNVRHTNVQTEL